MSSLYLSLECVVAQMLVVSFLSPDGVIPHRTILTSDRGVA